ncbi:PP2C family protein-serine/threonine phosphatase [Candidatus Poriferisodalis sp.]|uniref:PP2C family protein-serine/threonine phosphatase n=1 Tax=Candidatus Poriferisodalis sp. TaxID=3101277 RepID=UPI003C6F7B04
MSRTSAASVDMDIATRSEVGPRDRQEDRVRTVVNADGSWVMAVADGLGGHPFGDEAAQVAVDALPDCITSQSEMAAAFDAANAAAWSLHPEMRGPDEGVSSVIALTTLVVAAWNPQGGLLLSWVGDSMAFLVPIAGGPGWHSTPHGGPMGFVSRGIGMFRASPGSTYELPPGHLESLSEDVPAARVQDWVRDQGLLVVLATDGLFDPVLMAHDRGWFGDDPDDLSLGFALPPERRGSAEAVADTLIDTARFAGLIDNTTIAVARITAGRDSCPGDPAC